MGIRWGDKGNRRKRKGRGEWRKRVGEEDITDAMMIWKTMRMRRRWTAKKILKDKEEKDKEEKNRKETRNGPEQRGSTSAGDQKGSGGRHNRLSSNCRAGRSELSSAQQRPSPAGQTSLTPHPPHPRYIG